MTQTNKLHYIQKGIQLEIIKPQIQVTLTKTEVNQLITEALADPDSAAAIKRVLNPLLANKFPQFPTFTNAAMSTTLEDGSTIVTLREPKQTAPKPEVADTPESPLKSIEPLVVEEPTEESQPYVE